MKRKIAIAIITQSVGPATLFLTIWIIANEYGAEAQGRFSTFKSFIDLLVVLLLFGLPQSFVFGINRLQIKKGILLRWIVKYSSLILAIGCFVWMVCTAFSINLTIFSHEKYAELFVAVTISGLVAFNLFRAVYLTISDGWSFSVLTITPQIALFIISVVFVQVGSFEVAKIYAIVGVLSAVLAFLYIGKYIGDVQKAILPWRLLLKNGFAVLIQGLLISSQSLITFVILRQSSSTFAEVGFFSLATYIYQAGVIPLSMIGPILFNRWTSKQTEHKARNDLARLLSGLIPLSVISLILWVLTPWLLSVAFDRSYQSAESVIRIMIFSLPFLFVVHVGAPALMAIGLFKWNVVIFAIRLTASIFFLLLLLNNSSLTPSQSAAFAWLIAELISASIMIYVLVRKILHKTNAVI